MGDITYLATQEGWLYVATVISLQTRQVSGYSRADRMSDDLVQQAFLNAWATSPTLPADSFFHSDRGSQSASRDFTGTITARGFIPGMSRKGNCWDNAVAESFFATLKNEEADPVYESKAQAYAAIVPTSTVSTIQPGCIRPSVTCHPMTMPSN